MFIRIVGVACSSLSWFCSSSEALEGRMAGKPASLTQFTETLNKEFITLSKEVLIMEEGSNSVPLMWLRLGKKIMPQDEKGKDIQFLEKF